MSDNDKSVLCTQNEFQSRCNNSDTQVAQYSCTIFRNQTDNELLWYQELQKEAIFVPTYWQYLRANINGDCPSFQLVNFYVSEENSMTVKSVDMSRGAHLRNFDLDGTINICYISPLRFLNIGRLLTRFNQCLTLYGDGIDLNL